MKNSAQMLKEILGSDVMPIAIGFLDAPPQRVARWQGGAVPAGCVFWQKAMGGESFYTVPADHHNCAVGSHTHGISLPPGRAHELSDTLGFMAQSNYVAAAEVPGIPVLGKSPAAVAYGPVDRVDFRPDVVLLAASPAQAMLVYEAALKAGAGDAVTGALGRPACAVLPLTISSRETSISLGCKGNRTFTGLADEKMYLSIPGDKWEAVVEMLGAAHAANATMERFYQGRKREFASP